MSEIESLLREKVSALLSGGEIGYFIGWENTRTPNKTRVAFIRTAQDAQRLVWNRWCVNSTAKYLLDNRWPEQKIGIAARGCDTRAINRLIADRQIKRENLYIIGICCDGTANQICSRCAHPNPLVYDEILGEPVPEKAHPERFAEIEKMEAMSMKEKQEYWQKEFSKCIRCYACRNVCPCCSCRECYADQYRTGWQGKMMNPEENRFYGLTRAYHVGDRCIECGECERVCPVNLPIMLQTGKILKTACELFGDYECGLSGDEVNPLGRYQLSDRDSFM